jgi:FlaA1/EpsC-like NDP-sugar epimerase
MGRKNILIKKTTMKNTFIFIIIYTENTIVERKSMFRIKILLITGGTGSLEIAVLKRFINTDIGEIRIFSRDEKKQNDIRIAYNNDKLKFIIGDVRDYDSIYRAMRGVDYVFQCAALNKFPHAKFILSKQSEQTF